MNSFLVLLTLISLGHCIELKGLRAKYGNGSSEAVADNKEYFYKLPLNLEEAKKYGYKEVKGYPHPKNDVTMFCAPGRIICPLFLKAPNDNKSLVTGLRVNIPVQAISGDLKPNLYFDLWKAPSWNGEPKQQFWFSTQYFNQTNGTIVMGLDGDDLEIPALESDFNSTLFKKQNCVPNMGTHYYYNMTRDLTCDEFLLPWFALVDNGKTVGVGFQTFGDKSKVKIGKDQKDWFEDIPKQPRTTPQGAIPDAPDCFLDKSSKYGRLSIHIYYIEKPWELTCKSNVPSTQAPKTDSVSENTTNPTENTTLCNPTENTTFSSTTESTPTTTVKGASSAESHALNMVAMLISLALLVVRL